jgi:hypothetical protein
VKTDISYLNTAMKDNMKKDICERKYKPVPDDPSKGLTKWQCSLPVVFDEDIAYLQIYLELSGSSP